MANITEGSCGSRHAHFPKLSRSSAPVKHFCSFTHERLAPSTDLGRSEARIDERMSRRNKHVGTPPQGLNGVAGGVANFACRGPSPKGLPSMTCALGTWSSLWT